MTLFHLLAEHWGEGKRTGVPRFSRDFQRAFPHVENVTPADIGRLREEWALGQVGDIVVTDNHLAMLVPDHVTCVVVHHGCAPYHYSVDPGWRNPTTLEMATQQRRVLARPNTLFVAPSQWVWDRFAEIATPFYRASILPHWVEKIEGFGCGVGTVVIGDWRNENKGAGVIGAIRAACPEYEFRQLDFDPRDDAARRSAYLCANAYLCLSLSEGAPYSVADAEAASLPIITTPCGNVKDFPGVTVITEHERNTQPLVVGRMIASALATPRPPSFYDTFTFGWWRGCWRAVLSRAQDIVQ